MKEKKDTELDIYVGRTEFIISKRYEFVNLINDILIAIWFLVGSFFFMNHRLVTDGTWLFIVGSGQMLIRPCITVAKLFHLRRIRNR